MSSSKSEAKRVKRSTSGGCRIRADAGSRLRILVYEPVGGGQAPHSFRDPPTEVRVQLPTFRYPVQQSSKPLACRPWTSRSRRSLLLPHKRCDTRKHDSCQHMSTLRRALERAHELTSGALSSSIFDGDAAACGLYNRRRLCLHLVSLRRRKWL